MTCCARLLKGTAVRCSLLFVQLMGGHELTVLPDTNRTLEVVEINKDRATQFAVGQKIQLIDSIVLARYSGATLADLLSQQAPLSIKTYGIGLLATPSFRGAQADQVDIDWNGFKLQSPMNAVLDFSLVPVDFMQAVALQFGGSSALNGSGAIGGAIHLTNNTLLDDGFSVGVRSAVGSFGLQQNAFHIEWSNKNWASQLKVAEQSATNDFSYVDAAQYGSPTVKEQNAGMQQLALIQDNAIRLSTNQLLNVHFWFQTTDRNLPPSMTANDLTASQKDISLRSAADYKLQLNQHLLTVRAAYFDEFLDYYDPYASIASLSHSHSVIVEAEDKMELAKNQSVDIGVNNTLNEATADGYPTAVSQNRTTFFASYKIQSTDFKWSAGASVREELIGSALEPITPGLGLERKIGKWFVVHSTVTDNYRLPSFNDLYWTPGGNASLLPESGWSEDLGITAKMQTDQLNATAGLSVYNAHISNLITWLPPDYAIGKPFWYDANIQSVDTKGAEFYIQLKKQLARATLLFNANYNLVQSTNGTGSPAAIVGKQLIYIPTQTGGAYLAVLYKKITIDLTLNYTGYRYASADNTQQLPPYVLANFGLSSSFSLKHCQVQPFLRVNNLANETYQVLQWYPMPLRNWQGGIAIHFKQRQQKISS